MWSRLKGNLVYINIGFDLFWILNCFFNGSQYKKVFLRKFRSLNPSGPRDDVLEEIELFKNIKVNVMYRCIKFGGCGLFSFGDKISL